MVFLYMLVLNAVMVGMALGVLLPIPLAGLTFGGSLALMVGAFGVQMLQTPVFFPIAGGILGVLAAVLCVRYALRNLCDVYIRLVPSSSHSSSLFMSTDEAPRFSFR